MHDWTCRRRGRTGRRTSRRRASGDGRLRVRPAAASPTQLPAPAGPTGRRRGHRAGRRRGRGVARRWCWACATTSTRTASRRWCSGCPAASTRRWWPRIAVDALGPDRVVGVVDAQPALLGALPGRRRRPGQAHRPGLPGRADPADGGRLPGQPVAVRPGGGEPAGPGPRRDPDGAVQPGGPPGAHHRQQERAGGRLLHPVRRLGRRVQPDQGRLEDAGVAAGPVAQRRGRPARRDRRRSRRTRSASRRSAELRPGQLDSDTLPRLRRCSTRSWSATSTATRAATTWSPPATTRRWSTGCCGWWTSPSTSAGSPRPGTKISIKAFGRDRRLPITNRWRETADRSPARRTGCEISALALCPPTACVRCDDRGGDPGTANAASRKGDSHARSPHRPR